MFHAPPARASRTLLPLLLLAACGGRAQAPDRAEAWVRAVGGTSGALSSDAPAAPVSDGEPGWSLWAGQAVEEGSPVQVAEGVAIRPMSVGGSAWRLVAQAAADAVRTAIPVLRRHHARLGAACGAGTIVRLYQWPGAALPPERFDPDLSLAPNERLEGLYLSDAVAVPGGSEDVVVVVTADDAEVHEVLVHELAHYLYQRTCGARHMHQDSEAFAQRVTGRAVPPDGCKPHALLPRKRCR